MNLSELANRKYALLDKAYRGHVMAIEWIQLSNQYRRNGYLFNADWCIQKLSQFVLHA